MIMLLHPESEKPGRLLEQLNLHSDNLAESATRYEESISKADCLVLFAGALDESFQTLIDSVIKKHAGTVPITAVGAAALAAGQQIGIKLEKSNEALAGRTTQMVHDQSGLFRGLPTPLTVARYQPFSLAEEHLPPDCEISGHGYDGEILAVRSMRRLLNLLCFHPQSVAASRGSDIIEAICSNIREENR